MGISPIDSTGSGKRAQSYGTLGNHYPEGVEEWSDEDISDQGEKDAPDPIESGFDIPVL